MLLATAVECNNIMQRTESKRLPSPATHPSIVPTALHMLGMPEASGGVLENAALFYRILVPFDQELVILYAAQWYFHYSKNPRSETATPLKPARVCV